MKRTEIKTGTAMPTRRAKPLPGVRFKVPDKLCSNCVDQPPYKFHQCKSACCACVPCAERAGK